MTEVASRLIRQARQGRPGKHGLLAVQSRSSAEGRELREAVEKMLTGFGGGPRGGLDGRAREPRTSLDRFADGVVFGLDADSRSRPMLRRVFARGRLR